MKSKASKDPPGQTDLSRQLSLPLLWPQQDQSYLIVEVTWKFCNFSTFVGTLLRGTSYRIKTSDCYWVPSELTKLRPWRCRLLSWRNPAKTFSASSTPSPTINTKCDLDSSSSGCSTRRQPSCPPWKPLPTCSLVLIQKEPPLIAVIATDSDSDPVPQCSRPTLSANAQRATMTLLHTLIKQSVERLTQTIIYYHFACH